MTPENAKKLLPIIQAFADGKQIQHFEDNNRPGWYDTDSPTFIDTPDLYRIKPENGVIWLNVYVSINGQVFGVSHSSKESADNGEFNKVSKSSRIACVKVEYEEGEGL